MSFDDLMQSRRWEPIRNCPGRFRLVDAPARLSLEDLLDPTAQIMEFQSDEAKDKVLVAVLDRGGMISYKRDDGTLLHTLNTEEGFERKLRQLGIDLKIADCRLRIAD